MTKCNRLQCVLQEAVKRIASDGLLRSKKPSFATRFTAFCKTALYVLKNVYCFEANQNHTIFASNTTKKLTN